MVAIALAVATGWRYGSTSTPVPMLHPLGAGGQEREHAEAVPPLEGFVGALTELVGGVRVDGPEAVWEGDVVDGPEDVGAELVGDVAGPGDVVARDCGADVGGEEADPHGLQPGRAGQPAATAAATAAVAARPATSIASMLRVVRLRRKPPSRRRELDGQLARPRWRGCRPLEPRPARQPGLEDLGGRLAQRLVGAGHLEGDGGDRAGVGVVGLARVSAAPAKNVRRRRRRGRARGRRSTSTRSRYSRPAVRIASTPSSSLPPGKKW